MKKKNRPTDRRTPIIIFALIVGFSIIVTVVANLIQTSNRKANLVATVTAFVAESTGTQQTIQTNATEQAPTIEFEQIALTKIKEDPSLALTYTPFYAEIAFNEAIRQHTATPNKPSDTCELVAHYFVLQELATDIEAQLLETEFNASIFISTTGVYGAVCGQFHSVHTLIRVWIEIDKDPIITENNMKLMIDAIDSNFDQFEYLTPIQSNIKVIFHSLEGEFYLETNWQQIQEALLSEDGDLIASMGGLNMVSSRQEVQEE